MYIYSMLKVIFAYLIVYVVWGSTYLFIRMAVQDFSPFFVVGMRFLTGGILLVIFCFLRGFYKIPLSWKQIRNSLITGGLLLAGGNGLVTTAQKNVNSYLTALIIASTPVVVLIFDRVLFGKRVQLSGWFGSLLGIAGVSLLLLQNEGTVRFQLSPEIVLILGAMVSWALGTSLTKQFEMPRNSIVNASIQLFSVGIVFSLMAALKYPSELSNLPNVSLSSVAAVLYLALFGTVALGAYSFLLYTEPSKRVVTYALVNPLIAVLLGIVVAGESRVPFLIPGTFFILCGLILMFYGSTLWKLIRRKSINRG